MRDELDKKLVSDFRLLFSDRHKPMTHTCMCWGFDCGDGWYKIIRQAAEQLEPLIEKYKKDHPNEDYPRAAQIKEKFGTLRFYMTSYTAEMDPILKEAEHYSSITCEECGEPGYLREHAWLTTLCDKCSLKRLGIL